MKILEAGMVLRIILSLEERAKNEVRMKKREISWLRYHWHSRLWKLYQKVCSTFIHFTHKSHFYSLSLSLSRTETCHTGYPAGHSMSDHEWVIQQVCKCVHVCFHRVCKRRREMEHKNSTIWHCKEKRVEWQETFCYSSSMVMNKIIIESYSLHKNMTQQHIVWDGRSWMKLIFWYCYDTTIFYSLSFSTLEHTQGQRCTIVWQVFHRTNGNDRRTE